MKNPGKGEKNEIKSEEDSSETEKSNSIYMSNSTEKDTFRQSEREKRKPKYLNDYAVLALHAKLFVEDVLNSFDEIQDRDDKEEWLRAIQEEISALNENDTWEVVDPPPGIRQISCK